MDNSDLWDLIRATHRAILPFYSPLFDQYTEKNGLTPCGLGWLFAALTFEPETITPNRLRVRNSYTAADFYLMELEAVAEAGFLVATTSNEFSLTPSARAETLDLIASGRALMAQADPLPPANSRHLSALTIRLVRAALETSTTQENWSIRLSYRIMPDPEPPLPFFEQAVSCLHAFRDDAHLAAWKPGGLDAPTMETLTLLWRGKADSLDAICAALKNRGNPPHVYAEALAELQKRGFLEEVDLSPRLSKSGRSYRERIEQDTDRLFFAPWACLSEAEKVEMAELLTRLRDGLTIKIPGG